MRTPRCFAFAFALAGCAGAPPAPIVAPPEPYTQSAPLPGTVAVAFTIPRTSAPVPFFDLPWPSELARRPDGHLDLRTFPGGDTLLFSEYVSVAEESASGFSVAPAIYFHFTGGIEVPRFDDAAATPSTSSTVFLVDVDPASPERGTFFPLEHRFYTTAKRYVPASTLAVKPLAGFVLRPGTLYAAVVRRELGGLEELGTSMDLETVKWTQPREDPREEAARRVHAATFDYLETIGAPRARVAGIALFRTLVPQAVTTRMLEAVTSLPAAKAPHIVSAAYAEHLSNRRARPYTTIEGVYCTPNFQSGIERAPFLAGEGGSVTFDASGAPLVIDVPSDGPYASRECGGLLRARFVLTVPTSPMPPSGFPLLISAHGTGGSADSFLGDNDFAGWAASQGIAVVSTDQPLHGGRGFAPRPGSREPISISLGGLPITISRHEHAAEVAFYNPLHPAAARDNLRQAAIDGMVLLRLFAATDFATARAPDGSPLLAQASGIAPRFDRSRLLAAGHSQGSQSVAVMGAIDPMLRGVILSGCGGDARLGILRRHDLPVMPIFGALLGLEADELDELHPLMTLLQTLADPIDPGSYARLYWDPLPGRRPPSVLHYEGMTDTFTPPVTAEVLAVALHATPISPVVKPLPWLGAPARGIADLFAHDGPTRAFAQFRPTQRENGHFVIYYEPAASELAMQFMKAVVR